MLKNIEDLNLGFSDAQNYSQRANKQMFSDVFVKNTFLDKLLNPSVYYLVGEKGTGKTAYAVFLSNSEYKNCKSILKYISGTDYEKFYELKKRNHIDISGYVDIWKTILLLLLAKSVADNDRVVSIFNKNNLDKLLTAIDEYYNNAFKPEILQALKVMDKSEEVAKLIFKYAEASAGDQHSVEFSEERMQMNLYYICQEFTKCFEKLKLTKNITLFIDGIDVRPNQIPYQEYLECIKGLANACWTLNTELFANVKDSKGQFRIVLLLRPDIFNSLNLQNATNKLVDNAVYLDWRTTYVEYPNSNLYKMANKLLAYGQEEMIENIWERYFDWKLPSSKPDTRDFDTAFISVLRISLSRPRDVQRILSLLRNKMVDESKGKEKRFSYSSYNSDQFQNEYSEYFLSSLKDQLSFYYSEEDYKHFKKFFDFFDDSEFSYEDYLNAYNQYVEYICENASDVPQFADDPKTFLQLLYDSNVIAAQEEDGGYLHFSYREKSPTNISPEVPYGKKVQYRFHYGLYKKAKLGRY